MSARTPGLGGEVTALEPGGSARVSPARKPFFRFRHRRFFGTL